jgi:hypothetical protein
LKLGLSLANKLSQVRSSSHLSGGAAATYLEEQQPLIWRSSSHLSGGAAPTYLIQVKIKLTQPQVELEVWAELGKILKETSSLALLSPACFQI